MFSAPWQQLLLRTWQPVDVKQVLGKYQTDRSRRMSEVPATHSQPRRAWPLGTTLPRLRPINVAFMHNKPLLVYFRPMTIYQAYLSFDVYEAVFMLILAYLSRRASNGCLIRPIMIMVGVLLYSPARS